MRNLVSALVYAGLALILVAGFWATYCFIPEAFVVSAGWGFTALFAGLTISELREQLSGRLSELMLKHLGSPSRFKEACRIIVQRQKEVRRLALYGSFLNAIGAALSLIAANSPPDFEHSAPILGSCAVLLLLGIFIHFWLSTALSQVDTLFISYLQTENDEESKKQFLERSKDAPTYDFHDDPFYVASGEAVKPLERHSGS